MDSLDNDADEEELSNTVIKEDNIAAFGHKFLEILNTRLNIRMYTLEAASLAHPSSYVKKRNRDCMNVTGYLHTLVKWIGVGKQETTEHVIHNQMNVFLTEDDIYLDECGWTVETGRDKIGPFYYNLPEYLKEYKLFILNILKFIPATACVEAGYSLTNVSKTDLRSLLSLGLMKGYLVGKLYLPKLEVETEAKLLTFLRKELAISFEDQKNVGRRRNKYNVKSVKDNEEAVSNGIL